MAALDPLVSIDELAGWLRVPLTGSDTGWAALVLDMASALVRSEAGLTWAGVEVPAEARAVTFAVAARVWRNPEAATQRSKTTGPFNESMTFSNPQALGLFLSGQERAMLARFRSASRGLWALSTTRGDAPGLTGYVPVLDGGDDFPWYGTDVPLT